MWLLWLLELLLIVWLERSLSFVNWNRRNWIWQNRNTNCNNCMNKMNENDLDYIIMIKIIIIIITLIMCQSHLIMLLSRSFQSGFLLLFSLLMLMSRSTSTCSSELALSYSSSYYWMDIFFLCLYLQA